MNEQQLKWDPSEAITMEAIPLPRLVCWEGIIPADVLAGAAPEIAEEDETGLCPKSGWLQ